VGRWRDGLVRCETELATLATKTGQPASSAAATAALASLREEIKGSSLFPMGGRFGLR
jgi:hypothetical protein